MKSNLIFDTIYALEFFPAIAIQFIYIQQLVVYSVSIVSGLVDIHITFNL